MDSLGLQEGRVYRRRELHDRFGGQRQGGISTPRSVPAIMLITGESGSRYGYDDYEDDAGVYHYFGEGQRGTMRFIRGNRAVRDHATNGRELHLFEQVRSGWLRYRGERVCAGYDLVDDVPDLDGNRRQAIVFLLVAPDHDGDELADLDASDDLDQLRDLATTQPEREAEPVESRRKVYRRSRALRAYVRARAAGTCEGCEIAAPFTGRDGAPYLEPHHTRRVSDGGPDHPRWVIALCPTCHARVHYGADGDAYNEELQQELGLIESD